MKIKLFFIILCLFFHSSVFARVEIVHRDRHHSIKEDTDFSQFLVPSSTDDSMRRAIFIEKQTRDGKDYLNGVLVPEIAEWEKMLVLMENFRDALIRGAVHGPIVSAENEDSNKSLSPRKIIEVMSQPSGDLGGLDREMRSIAFEIASNRKSMGVGNPGQITEKDIDKYVPDIRRHRGEIVEDVNRKYDNTYRQYLDKIAQLQQFKNDGLYDGIVPDMRPHGNMEPWEPGGSSIVKNLQATTAVVGAEVGNMLPNILLILCAILIYNFLIFLTKKLS